MSYRWKVKSLTDQFEYAYLTYFRTKKDAIDCLKEIYFNEHVPFFELDNQGKLDGFSFKEFLTDFEIIKL